MTKEQQRIAIAQKCGHQTHDKHDWDERDDRRYFVCTRCGEAIGWKDYSNNHGNFNNACSGVENDYPNDLNAMHEAELMCCRDGINGGYKHGYYSKLCDVAKAEPTFATAGQRAEAFCRTFWPERF